MCESQWGAAIRELSNLVRIQKTRTLITELIFKKLKTYCSSGKTMRLGRASGAGFSLWGLVLARTKPHRLKPAPLGTSSLLQGFQNFSGGFFDVGVEAVAVGVHRHDGREIFHAQVPHRFGDAKFH